MISFPPQDSLPPARLSTLKGVGSRLKAASPADTVACAYGIGTDVLMWHDESEGQYFDLASLTKPLFTATTVLPLVANRGVLDAPVGSVLNWLPHMPDGPTARRLLTHSAGLPAELPVDRDVPGARRWLSERVQAIPATKHRIVYSDPGYWMLGNLASELAAAPLHDLFLDAPTAASGQFLFGGAPVEQSVPAGPVVGDVRFPHDPAARRLGPSGHAGAFGTLAGVIHATLVWLDGSWLPDSVAREAVACQTHLAPGGHRSLAWTLAGDPYHSVAHDWPPTTLCHTGFTGVCVALDPVSRWWGVFLSNAIPVDRDAGPVLIARRHFYASAADHLRDSRFQ